MARIPEERLLVLGALVRQIADEITQQLGGQLPR
jgi:IclR family acetate operon transcriptional repressor